MSIIPAWPLVSSPGLSRWIIILPFEAVFTNEESEDIPTDLGSSPEKTLPPKWGG